jgi:hypothetical protein
MSSSAFTPTTTQVTTEVPVNVPVVTKDKLFTPIIGISGTFSSQKGEYQRSGNRMNARVQLSFATVSAINSPYTLTLPDSLTYDGSNIPVSDEPIVGTFSLWDASASYIEFMGTVHVNSSNSLKFKAHGQTAFNNSSTPVTIAANDILEIQFSIPIAEWAGSGTTTLADRALEEYVSNGAAAGNATSDLTDFKYGPAGSLIGNITAANGLVRRVRFQTPLLATDNLIVEVSTDRVMWFPMTCMQVINGAPIDLYLNQNGTRYGMGRLEKANSTDIDVTFGAYSFSQGATYGSAGNSWATVGVGYWRVRKVSSGAQVGYPISTKNIVGATDGVAPVTGMLGEVVSSSGSVTVAHNVISTISTITLQPGNWEINAAIDFSFIGAASPSAGSGYSISISTSTSFSGLAGSDSQALNPFSSIASTRPLGNLRSKRYINVPQGSTQIIYLLAAQATTVNLTGVFLIDAKRIA